MPGRVGDSFEEGDIAEVDFEAGHGERTSRPERRSVARTTSAAAARDRRSRRHLPAARAGRRYCPAGVCTHLAITRLRYRISSSPKRAHDHDEQGTSARLLTTPRLIRRVRRLQCAAGREDGLQDGECVRAFRKAKSAGPIAASWDSARTSMTAASSLRSAISCFRAMQNGLRQCAQRLRHRARLQDAGLAAVMSKIRCGRSAAVTWRARP